MDAFDEADQIIREATSLTVGDDIGPLRKRILDLVDAEREACAAVASAWRDPDAGTAWGKVAEVAADEIADAILARAAQPSGSID